MFWGLGRAILRQCERTKVSRNAILRIKGLGGGGGRGNDGSQAVIVTVGQRDALLAQPSVVIGRSRLISLTSADTHAKS